MPPQYHDQTFWNKRFEHETLFEWLGDGQITMLPPLNDFLVQYKSHRDAVPEILHIGAGTSIFQEHVKNALIQVYGRDVDCRKILNTDFSDMAVMKGRSAAANSGAKSAMRWAKADLTKWEDMRNISSNTPGRFAMVLDKSTSDAVSCGPSMIMQAKPKSDVDPLVQEIWSRDSSNSNNGSCSVSPLELLAMNLAFCVEPGGIWIALSYSSDRFPFMRSSSLPMRSNEDSKSLDISSLWTIESMIAIDAPSGQDKPGVHAPSVQHHLYTLRRTSTPL
ncbi:hypothetical protein NEOLEDRAFT_1077710 [Neolentinus lepideus HHB14362 ss-1]|uniref:Histidine-specific methyltransferase SAM-dependent domain-containing protein n=1 Tax=Neolentinus lepideus HHB14362 ss-1 TaxID=1314782 RepID=A0A165ND61_9AGAM|nr:hypothetical protein NEOLEDRAFT_1077710 [Neolentinus lepideus HHB14362 ss-1]